MPLIGRLARGPANPMAARGTSAAPSAAAAVVSIASVPAGKYVAHCFTRTTGTDEPKRSNMDLRSSATPAATLASGLQSGTQPGGYIAQVFELTGTSTLSINAIANATAATTYDATLILERIA